MASAGITRGFQEALLWVYRGLRRSGILGLGVGSRTFEGAYWAYKSLVEARELASLRDHVPPGATVIDVGANIGFFAMRFAEWAGPSGHVIAIEPEAANFASLVARTRRRGFEARISLVNAAAIEAPGTVFLKLNPDHPADHRVAESGTPVEGVSIDSLLARELPPVSLIKIDVQGGELGVLRGARQTISRDRPALFVEFQESGLALAGTSSRKLMEELRSMGYRPHLKDRTWQAVEDDAVFRKMESRDYVDVLLLADPPTNR